MGTRFSEAYAEIQSGLASSKFSQDKDWQALLKEARKLAGVTGFDVGHAGVVGDLRKKVAKAAASGANEAVTFFQGAGETLSGKGPGVLVDGDLAKRLGALKTLRHTYLLKRFGGHKVWIVSLPTGFTAWPHEALKGGLSDVTQKLTDKTERFNDEARKHLSNASQEGLKWVHKALSVTGSPKQTKNFATISRWFADNGSTDADMLTAAATLSAGFKKIAAKLKSGHLIYTDSVSERGTTENAGTEAFVWGDKLDVVYIEEEFFGKQNSLTGLTNWARIVVHELTHREVATKDHAYEHQAINPKKLTAAKAIENADSWAWFCADCAGSLTDNLVKNALDR
jgi:Lysine-specific metallo-endopeptidase